MNYIIRNDVTHRTWCASAAEARFYALGGPLDAEYTVFHRASGTQGLLAVEVR